MRAASPARAKSPFHPGVRESFRQMLGTDDFDPDTALFTHHRHLMAHALETILLLLLLVPVLLVPLADIGNLPYHEFHDRAFEYRASRPLWRNAQYFLVSVLPTAGVQFLVLGGMLPLMRFVRRAWLLAVCLLLWTAAAFAGLFRYGGAYEAWTSIQSNGFWPAKMGPMPFPVPTVSLSIFMMLVVLAAILGAMLAVRSGYAHWKWIAGTVAGALAGYALLGFELRELASYRAAGGLTLIVLFSFVFARLPHSRRILGGLTGVVFRNADAVRPAVRCNAVQAACLYGAFGVFALLLAGGFLLRRETVALGNLMENGPAAPHFSPALTNAQTALGPLYMSRNRSYWSQIHLPDHPVRALLYSLFLAETSPDDARSLLDTVAVSEVDAAFADIDQFVLPYLEAANADYYWPDPNPGGWRGPDFVLVRQVGRMLCARSVYNANAGRTEEALRDLRAVYRFGGLLSEPGFSFYGALVGASAQSSAGFAAYSSYLAWRGDPENLRRLLAELNGLERDVHVDFPGRGLFEGMFGMSPVAICFENTMPRFGRGFEFFDDRWIVFDQVRILTAMELYRHETGEWPAAQEDLVPRFLPQVLRDPYAGLPYAIGTVAIVDDSGVPTGETEPIVDQGGGPITGDLTLPPSAVRNGDVKKAVETYLKAIGRNDTATEAGGTAAGTD